MKRLFSVNRLIAAGLLVGSALACVAPDARAEIVTHKQAMKLAQQFFNEAAGEVTPAVTMVYNGKNLTTKKLFTPFYTFNSPDGGFVIVSADNKTLPILAYSLTDKFDESRLTAAQRELLRSYAHHVEMIRYDSRVPEEAIKAWGDFPHYAYALLHTRPEVYYSVSEPQGGEGTERMERLLALSRADDLYSEIYTPQQWYELTDGQLTRDGYVLTGVIDPQGYGWPMTVNGKVGEMYRVVFEDAPSPWTVRLFATEYLSDGLIADFTEVPVADGEFEEVEIPFDFYRSIMADFAADAEARTRAIEESLHPSEPIVRPLGGGRFSVAMPSEVKLVRLYNVEGAMIGQQTYGGTQTAWIDLGSQPGGFYIAHIFSENADPVSFKLYR